MLLLLWVQFHLLPVKVDLSCSGQCRGRPIGKQLGGMMLLLLVMASQEETDAASRLRLETVLYTHEKRKKYSKELITFRFDINIWNENVW